MYVVENESEKTSTCTLFPFTLLKSSFSSSSSFVLPLLLLKSNKIINQHAIALFFVRSFVRSFNPSSNPLGIRLFGVALIVDACLQIREARAGQGRERERESERERPKVSETRVDLVDSNFLVQLVLTSTILVRSLILQRCLCMG